MSDVMCIPTLDTGIDIDVDDDVFTFACQMARGSRSRVALHMGPLIRTAPNLRKC